MAKLVNLSRARKQRARADRREQSAQTAAAHGRTKSERSQTQAERAAAEARLDAHRRDEDG